MRNQYEEVNTSWRFTSASSQGKRKVTAEVILLRCPCKNQIAWCGLDVISPNPLDTCSQQPAGNLRSQSIQILDAVGSLLTHQPHGMSLEVKGHGKVNTTG